VQGPDFRRQEAVRRVLQGMTDDSVGYADLANLAGRAIPGHLAAPEHPADSTGRPGHRAVEPLDARRRQRVSLVTALLGAQGDMSQLFALLQEDARATAERDWIALEQMVLECKRLNARNSDLLTEQYSIMQRVLHGEEDTYAPG